MRIKRLLPILIVMLLMSGCVPSLNPIFTEKDLFTDPELIGNWIDDNDRDTWTFQSSDDNNYELTQKSEKTPAKYDAHLVRLGRFTFLDLYPKEPKKAEFKNNFYKLHFVPTHTFSRIWIEKDRLQIALFNDTWLEEMLAQGKTDIRYERPAEGFFLTASTGELQQLLLEHAEDPDMFQKPFQLRRKQSDTESDSRKKETAQKDALGAPANREQLLPVLPQEPALPFEFQVNFWINLHHFLYQQARLQEKSSIDKFTPAELLAWSSALDYYRQSFAKSDLLFDNDLVNIKNRLSDLKTAEELKGSGLRAELINALEQAAPVYRKYWWPEHERANQAWINSLTPLLQRFGRSLTEELGAAYGEKWPARPIRVDVAVYANWAGAYTTLNPVHIMVSSSDDRNQGLIALETVFHEASHALIGGIRAAIGRECKAHNKVVPRDLWHALLFYTTGEIVKRTLKNNGMGDYIPYAYRYGLYERATGWKNYQRALELHWQPYLNGKMDADAALACLVEAF